MDHRQVEWVRASIADEVGDALTDEQLDRVAHVAVKQTITWMIGAAAVGTAHRVPAGTGAPTTSDHGPATLAADRVRGGPDVVTAGLASRVEVTGGSDAASPPGALTSREVREELWSVVLSLPRRLATVQ